MKIMYDQTGAAIQLGRELGKGGEGSVFEVPGRSVVAKLYHKPISDLKAQKLETMARVQTPQLLALAAWPVSVLRSKRGSSAEGLLMPRIDGHREVHKLYSPKSRRSEFPSATFPFLVRTATNTARAFAIVHSHGHVIGDVNHGNLLVSPQAVVKLIDCDSYQIHADGKTFVCEVGVSTYTPPELQNAVFKNIVRNSNHDCFGLAVMVFHLLFMGRHPFAGRFHGLGDMPIERAIHECRFAYSAQASACQMSPPPNTLGLTELSKSIADLLERAFSRQFIQTGRPTASQWVAALEELERSLQQCGRSRAHYFLKSTSTCPWCRIETLSGISMFGVQFAAPAAIPGFDLEKVWAQILSVPGPQVPVQPPAPAVYRATLNKSTNAIHAQRSRGVKYLQAFIALAVTIGGVALFQLTGLGAVIALAVGAFIAISLFQAGTKIIASLRTEYSDAHAAYQDLIDQWHDNGHTTFQRKTRALQEAKDEYARLPSLRLEKLRQLEKQRYQMQLRRFLERHRIEDASIPGVGSGRKDLLSSFGIEDADDVTEQALAAVPGFGDKLTARVLLWRQSIEQRFMFNTREGVDPRDIRAVEQEIQTQRATLERRLANGPAELKNFCSHLATARMGLLKQLEVAAKRVAQAELDLRFL